MAPARVDQSVSVAIEGADRAGDGRTGGPGGPSARGWSPDTITNRVKVTVVALDPMTQGTLASFGPDSLTIAEPLIIPAP